MTAAALQLLALLAATDEAIEGTLGLSSAYVVEDECSRAAVVKMLGVDAGTIRAALRLLLRADFVFRFSCALKFGWPDEGAKQVRITSWGRAFLRRTSLATHSLAGDRYVERILITDRDAYEALARLLVQAIDEDTAERIRMLNAGRQLKLLS